MKHALLKSVFFLFWAYVFAELYSAQVENFTLLYVGFLLFAFVTTELANRYLSIYNSHIYAFYVFNPVFYAVMFAAEAYAPGFHLENFPFSGWCLRLILFTFIFWFYIKSLSKTNIL